jgi:hypothetical protein
MNIIIAVLLLLAGCFLLPVAIWAVFTAVRLEVCLAIRLVEKLNDMMPGTRRNNG